MKVRADLGDAEANELIQLWRDYADPSALHRLIKGHTRLLQSVVRKSGAHSPEDALQEAHLGFLRAVEKYDPGRGRFWNYAYTWAHSFVQRFMYNDVLVKVGGVGAEERHWFRIVKAMKKLVQEGVEPTVGAISEVSGIPEGRVFHVLGNRFRTLYLDLYYGFATLDVDTMMLIERLPNEDEQSAGDKLTLPSFDERIENFMRLLGSRDLDIFDKRLWSADQKFLSELGRDHGISRERVRQLQNIIIGWLTRYFQDELRKMGFTKEIQSMPPWPPKEGQA